MAKPIRTASDQSAFFDRITASLQVAAEKGTPKDKEAARRLLEKRGEPK